MFLYLSVRVRILKFKILFSLKQRRSKFTQAHYTYVLLNMWWNMPTVLAHWLSCVLLSILHENGKVGTLFSTEKLTILAKGFGKRGEFEEEFDCWQQPLCCQLYSVCEEKDWPHSLIKLAHVLLEGCSLRHFFKQQLFGFGGGACFWLHEHLTLQRPVSRGTLVQEC